MHVMFPHRKNFGDCKRSFNTKIHLKIILMSKHLFILDFIMNWFEGYFFICIKGSIITQIKMILIEN